MSFGCTRTNSTTKSRMSATELAVDATIDRAGMPSGELGSLSVRHKKTREELKMWFTDLDFYISCVRLSVLTIERHNTQEVC